MTLIYTNDFCRERSRSAPQLVYGWYSYELTQKKIPFVGLYCVGDQCVSDNGFYLKLVVPKNIFNYSFDEKCSIESYSEIFLDDGNSSTWQNGNNPPLPVNLTKVSGPSWKSKANLLLKRSGVEVSKWDLGEIAGSEFIDDIKILAQKVGQEFIYVILRYSYPSNPGSMGFGNCGAGVEEFIAYVEIDQSFEIRSFEKIQTNSCIDSIYDVIVEYDIQKPERGMKRK